jgi:Rrf2 family nitric oxide-sensitive transcriptional repressor
VRPALLSRKIHFQYILSARRRNPRAERCPPIPHKIDFGYSFLAGAANPLAQGGPRLQLTRYSDYSLRVLIYLALAPDRLATIEEIARSYRISKAHLMKVVHQLGLRGWVETVRGRGGGLRLAREPEAIRVGEVVRATEGSLALVECFEPAEGRCAIESACGLRPVLHEALAAFLAVLDRYTLADLVARRRKPLSRLLEAS